MRDRFGQWVCSRFALIAGEGARAPSEEGLPLSYGVEEQRISRQRLAAILRPKSEKDDTAFAHGYFDQRGFAFESITAQKPAGE